MDKIKTRVAAVLHGWIAVVKPDGECGSFMHAGNESLLKLRCAEHFPDLSFDETAKTLVDLAGHVVFKLIPEPEYSASLKADKA